MPYFGNPYATDIRLHVTSYTSYLILYVLSNFLNKIALSAVKWSCNTP